MLRDGGLRLLGGVGAIVTVALPVLLLSWAVLAIPHGVTAALLVLAAISAGAWAGPTIGHSDVNVATLRYAAAFAVSSVVAGGVRLFIEPVGESLVRLPVLTGGNTLLVLAGGAAATVAGLIIGFFTVLPFAWVWAQALLFAVRGTRSPSWRPAVPARSIAAARSEHPDLRDP